MQTPTGYFKRRGWKDLIFVAVVLTLGAFAKRQIYPTITDVEKWKRRPAIDKAHLSVSATGESGLWPCFFFHPGGMTDRLQDPGSVEDCKRLVPDGKDLDLFEVVIAGGFAHIKTDLYLPGPNPIAFTRVMQPLTDWSKRNRIYLRHVYDPFLSGSRAPYTYLDWRLPDDDSIHFHRISTGTGFEDAVYQANASDPTFVGARVGWNGFGWDLTLEDGTTYLSPEAYAATRPQQGSLVAIFDSKGNEIRLLRAANGDLRQITSPDGQWIRLHYDDEGRITRAWASSGASATYQYDTEQRIVAVQYSSGELMEYSYDTGNRVVGIKDAARSILVTNRYAPDGAVVEVTAGPSQIFGFRATVDREKGQVEAAISGHSGEEIVVKAEFGKDGARYLVQRHE